MTENGKTKGKSKIETEREIFEEISKVMRYLGRQRSEGQVKGDNLTKILKYLIYQKNEPYNRTLSKIALICGMGARYVKENYLKGIEEFGFIRIYVNGNTVYWEWLGIPDDRPLADFLR